MDFGQGKMEDLVEYAPCSPSPEFWCDKRVLVTGHTGFKGAWLTIWLHRLGADVTGISLPPVSGPNLFDLAGIKEICASTFCDIRDCDLLSERVAEARPEVIFHLAAQPLVRESYADPLATYSTNVMGTAHLLDACRTVDGLSAVVMVTTDKVYRNREWAWPYRENDTLGGHDPYSASKAASEIVIESYREAFLSARNVAVASARAGNVIGGGDWSEDRLIPDAVRAWQTQSCLEIRRPDAVRPWQHVLEPLAGYLVLAETLSRTPELAGAYNFGPSAGNAATVRSVVELARKIHGTADVRYGDGTEGPHESNFLSLEASKSRNVLGAGSRWPLGETVKRTMDWYLAQRQGNDALTLCQGEIDAYEGTS